jgi:UDP-N-acetylmuramate dehydrogenase
LTNGLREGAVGLSTRHTLSIVAHDGARASDIVRFSRKVRSTVKDKFGVTLVPEPHFWGFEAAEDGLPVL